MSGVVCGERDDPVFGGMYGRTCARALHHPGCCSEVPDPPEMAAVTLVVEDVEDAAPVGEVLPFPAYALRRLLGGRRAAVAGRGRAL